MIDRLPPRPRFVLRAVYTTTIGYLAAVGLSAMIDGRARVPDLSGIVIVLVIVGYAALARFNPEKHQTSELERRSS